MTGFSIDWLDLREPADSKARDKALALQALHWLQKKHPNQNNILVDLGAGTGSTLRALTAFGIGSVVWRLVDNDGELLDEALRRHGKNFIIEDYQSDLNIVNELPLNGANLVTASALFDLASPEFVAALAKQISGQQTALYAALNYDGKTEWDPPHPLDAVVLQAFNQDQLRDKGFGPALGPGATDYVKTIFQASGYEVFTADSPWILTDRDHSLVSALIQGIANAVNEHLNGADLNEWKDFRLAHAAKGTCTIGHMDLLALPVKN